VRARPHRSRAPVHGVRAPRLHLSARHFASSSPT
jgi:hypothetical protein